MDIARLYEKYGDSMYRYLSVKLGSASDAEDVLQEVFCRLVRYSARLRLARRPRAFVFRVARNEANRFLRTKIHEGSAARPEALPADSFLGLYQAPEESSGRLVARAMAGLPDAQREVIILKVYEGLTFREIAAVCREPIPTVASRYRYGLEKLRGLLEGKL